MQQPLQEGQRYRCTACGNLTRFDVIRTLQLKEYYHVEIGGAINVEEHKVLSEEIVSVRCRWCDNGTTVEIIEGPGAA